MRIAQTKSLEQRAQVHHPITWFVIAAVVALMAAFVLAATPTQAHAIDWNKNPVEISSAADLDAMRKAVNNDENGARTKNYVLTADIDLSSIENWTPIGLMNNYNANSGNSFNGTFDGNGYVIRNLKINSLTSAKPDDPNYPMLGGLFGSLYKATVKNVTLYNVSIVAYSYTDRDTMVGALSAFAKNTTITGCNVVEATIRDKESVARTDTKNYTYGGLVGDIVTNAATDYCIIENCSVSACNIEAKATYQTATVQSQPFAGGIVGRVRPRDAGSKLPAIEACYFNGTIKSSGYVGPIVAGVKQGELVNTAISKTESAVSSVIKQCYYDSTFSNLNDAFNLTGSTTSAWSKSIGDVWTYNASFATDASGSSQGSALSSLRTYATNKSYPSWRIYSDNSKSMLTLEFRRARIESAILANGEATLTASDFEGCLTPADKEGLSYQWVVDGNVATSGVSNGGKTLTIPITENSQKVVLQIVASDKSVVYKDEYTVDAAFITASIKKVRSDADNRPKVTALEAAVIDNPVAYPDGNFEYVWYGIADDGSEKQLSTSKTLENTNFNNYTKFKLVVKVTGTSVSDEATADISTTVVYVKEDGGVDTNDGYTPDSPVATLAQAYEQLPEDGTVSTNTIVIMDTYEDVAFGLNDKKTFNKPATITSNDESPDSTKDYRDDGAYLSWYASNNQSASNAKEKLLFADTRLKDITLNGSGKTGYVYCQGNSLTVDTGVVMEKYANANSQKSYGYLSGSNAADFHIVGGFLNYSEPVGTPLSDTPCNIVLKSGSYARVIAGCRTSGNPSQTSYNQFGSEDDPFNVNITVDINSEQSQMGGSNKYTCDIVQLCGGQLDGTIYANSSITLENGTVPLVLGSSVGYDRAVGGGYPNNDFVGTASVTMNGGSVVQLYGGCLGRINNSSEGITVDSRFKSFKNKSDSDAADISLNITGGTIGATSSIKVTSGVFACGAGGITGEYDSAAGKVTNSVVVKVAISGGTIEGNVYGGGYGQSSAVSTDNARLACSEAGNLYGSSTLEISGSADSEPTITGNVYGGGAGTDAYLKATDPNYETNALAQIIGDVSVRISGATITGNVYGGGQGVVGFTESYNCANMAKITGNVTLTLENATVDGSVYGGSAYGQITGTVNTTVKNSSVSGSIYGASQGKNLADDDAGVVKTQQTVENQKAVGYVGSNVSLALEGTTVTGNVFGGGMLGYVDGGTSTTIAATEGGAAATVGGSVFGAGQGAVLSTIDQELQQVVGYVNGDAKLEITGASIAGSVYGGGQVGSIAGGTSVKLDRAQVGESVYGAAQGAYLQEATIVFQEAVGQVPGNVTLELWGNTQVGTAEGAQGNVYGGGELGVAGSGTLTTDTYPYTVEKDSTVTVLVGNATVKGSVFGGGQGNASAAGEAPRLLGAVFGSTSVIVYEGSVGADVFGGGNLSLVYAPFDPSGNPQQATSVVVNAAGSIYVNADGSVAENEGEGVTLVNEVPNTWPERNINLGGSVFGGGNISDPNTVRASNVAVYGTTDTYIKGAGVTFNGSVGGVYGDGNLTTVRGQRDITLIDLWTPAKDEQGNEYYAMKSFYSLQRADNAVVHNSGVYLLGATDRVSESDKTYYSLNRVENLRLYEGSTVQFDTVVNGLGNLWSDVLSENDLINGGQQTDYGDLLIEDEKSAYRNFVKNGGSAGYTVQGQTYFHTNSIIVNNGKWLDVKSADGVDNAYGTVTGLFSLTTDTAGSGGAFVFGRRANEADDCTGTFVSLNCDDAGKYLELYTQPTSDVENVACRTWYILAETYNYERTVRAYAQSRDSVQVQVLLPVSGGNSYDLTLDGAVQADDGAAGTLKDMYPSKKAAKSAENGGYYFDAAIAEGGAVTTSSGTLALYDGSNPEGWKCTYAPGGNTQVLQMTFTLHLEEVHADPSEQTGHVKFTLTSTGGEVYTFDITIVIEKLYAMASYMTHYGKVYESIPVQDAQAITPTSAYSTQFTTTYCPGAYSSLKTVLSTQFNLEYHDGKNYGSIFPAGTVITMVDVTNSSSPKYYYYECREDCSEVPLSEFENMAGGSWSERSGYTVVTESLVFVVDYANVTGGMNSGSTYLTLEHLYKSNPESDAWDDILHYTRAVAKDDGTTEQQTHYNELCVDYPISNVTDADVFTVSNQGLTNPDGGASAVKTSHTTNYMYDTYTTQITVNSNTGVFSQLYEDNEVALRIGLVSTRFWDSVERKNTTFPIGSVVEVRNASDDSECSMRYYQKESSGWFAYDEAYIIANLGSKPNGTYTITLYVPRYYSNATDLLFGSFPWWTDWFETLYEVSAELYRSSDGLYVGNEGSALWSDEAALSVPDSQQKYELISSNVSAAWTQSGNALTRTLICTANTASDLVDSNGAVTGIQVWRRAANSSDDWVSITTVRGNIAAVDADVATGGQKFEVTDYPSSGTYDYMIWVGNTLYYQKGVVVD